MFPEDGVRPQGESWQLFRSRERCWARFQRSHDGRTVIRTKDGRVFELESFKRNFEQIDLTDARPVSAAQP